MNILKTRGILKFCNKYVQIFGQNLKLNSFFDIIFNVFLLFFEQIPSVEPTLILFMIRNLHTILHALNASHDKLWLSLCCSYNTKVQRKKEKKKNEVLKSRLRHINVFYLILFW